MKANGKSALSALVAVGIAAGAAQAVGITDLRFWGWKSDVETIGELTFVGAIGDKSDLLIKVTQQLIICQLDKANDCLYLLQEIDRLKREIGDLKDKKEKVLN